jgi:putative peptidoglycan lipid II flippase
LRDRAYSLPQHRIPARSSSRQERSAFYALLDPKTPLRFAMVRVSLTGVLGLLFAFPLRPYIIKLIVLLHMPLPNLPEGTKLLGVIGLTASAGMAGWIEFALLRRALARRIGSVKLAPSFLGRLWISGLAAAIAGVACHRYVAPVITPHVPFRHISEAILVSGAFGAVYFAAAIALGINEARATLKRFVRR